MFTRGRLTTSIATLALLASASLFAADRSATGYRGVYALILQDKPAVEAIKGGAKRGSPQVAALQESIRTKQRAVIAQVEGLGIHSTGSVNTVLNAVFVRATPRDLAKLRAIQGVAAVVPMRKAKPTLNAAASLVDAPNAWNLLGGTSVAGSGQKIAIIDTGIDQTHPAFQDSTLAIPAGFPKCDTVANCAYTTNKIIVARSYVGLDAGTDPAFDFPDDLTPRDRVGHGTGVAMAAGGNTNAGPLATIRGFAPKAYLGNYKIYGSPGVNDGSSEQAIIDAFEDALNDGMDVANLSSGFLPFSGPLDTGSFCGEPVGTACDPLVEVIENVIAGGMVVVVAAGNDGADGIDSNVATLNTIASPGYAPDTIAVAATGNSRLFAQSVQISGPNAPVSVQFVSAVEGQGLSLASTLTAPLIDAGTVGDQYACSAFPANSMNGDIALIERGPNTTAGCEFETKLDNAETAGAVGAMIYDYDSTEAIIPITIGDAEIPGFFVSNSDGLAIKAYVDSTAGVQASLNPVYNSNPVSAPDVNQVTMFSSRGPVTGTYNLKPDVAAPGENIYTAAQNLDPNGELYNASRYILTSGTSFSTPIVAGIAAMVREKNPSFTALEVKSAIVNTATNDTTDPSYSAIAVFPSVLATTTGLPASPTVSVGLGKVEALSAISTTVTSIPATVSFGLLTQGAAVAPVAQGLTITNHGTTPLTLTLTVNRAVTDASTTLALSTSSLTLAAGTSQTVDLTLSGTGPAPNLYYGAVTIAGGPVVVNVPFQYLVSTGAPFNLFSVAGDYDVGFINQSNAEGVGLLKVIDQYGVGVPNLPLTWTAENGGAISNADSLTDSEGFAGANFTLGPDVGSTYNFDVTIGSYKTFTFTDYAYAQPTISAGGVANAASFQLGQGIAPGSLVAVFGTGFSGDNESASYLPLPISINSPYFGLPVSLGFDATGVSVPAPLLYVSPGQINIQVPWELAGQTTATMKVNLEPLNGALFTVPIATYSPACYTANNLVSASDLNYNPITSSNPAIPGDYVILYCNGLGPVNNTPATGAAAQDSTSSTTTMPSVTIGGQAATVSFSGLAPGYAGLYQINVLVPSGVAAGTQPVAVSIGGVSAPTVNIPVQ